MNGDQKKSSWNPIFFCFIIGGLMFFQSKSSKKLKNNCKDASIQQYINRLTEFFDSDQMHLVRKEFLEMIDYGLYPKNAFKILTFDGELN